MVENDKKDLEILAQVERASYHKKNKFGEWFKDNMMKLMIVIISAIYVIQGLFYFTRTSQSLSEIVGKSALSLCVGIVITGLMHRSGLKDGRKDSLFKASVEIYADTKQLATPYFDKLPAWVEYKNNQELEMVKREIITGANLSWKGYKYGYYNEHRDGLTQEQVDALENAKNAKIERLSGRELLSDLPSNMKTGGIFGFFGKESKFGKGERDYDRDSIISNVIGKIGTAIISGLYTIMPLINGNNYQEVIANVLWNALQVIMWLSFGVMKYYNSKSFIVDEYRQTHIIQKTEYLNEFIMTMKNNPKVVEEYDKDIEINLYIENFIKELNSPLKEETNNGNN